MTYGEHIMTTGEGAAGYFEQMLSRFLYERHFQGKAPVLDLAAGRCWFTRQNISDIQAVDIAPELVAHYSAEGIQITEGSAYSIPHPDGTFAAVFCCWLFEHLEAPDVAMREIYRVLQPAGMCFLVVPSEHQLGRGFFDDYTHLRPYTRNSLRQLACSNGFTAPEISCLPYTRFWGRLIPVLGHQRALVVLRLVDRWLRPLGIVNKNMLTLKCYR
jgi:SAM-dependent methyltransferase